MGPTKYNIVNLIQGEDGSFSTTWLDGNTIYWNNNMYNSNGKIDVDIPCLISSLYNQYPDLFPKFAK